MEVDERLLGDLSLDVTLVLGFLKLLDGGVVGGDIGVVVLGVVQLHDLAADGGLKRAVVVWEGIEVSVFVFLASSRRSLEGLGRTRQVGQSGLAAGEGGAANGSAHGGRKADGGAQGAGTEESGGHCECVGSYVVGFQWYSGVGGVVDGKRRSVSVNGWDGLGKLKSSRVAGDVMLSQVRAASLRYSASACLPNRRMKTASNEE